ncbi:MAG: hypothetical protein QOE33_3469 [Acidobacteriota bacterium]|nr:hypothetical protein [Acidobacteriota bacterium]
MASTFTILMDGTPADDDFYTGLSSLEVEENLDLPSAIQLSLPVSSTGEGELTFVSDGRLRPFANLAVEVTVEDKGDYCIFDGYVLSHKLHLQTGTTSSTLQVWGQDASWLMNLEEKTREWTDVTDASVANNIFDAYDISPAPQNTDDDTPSHTESGHTLMQRASDIQFLRGLARRSGKLCWVACADRHGERIGYFTKPNLDGDPLVTLTLNDPDGAWTVQSLDFDWDVTRPTVVAASQTLFNDNTPEGVSAGATDSGLDPLDERSLEEFSGKTMSVLLTSPGVDDGGELQLRAQALLREAGWFMRCEGETDVARLNALLRAGMVVMVNAAGTLYSGKYFVWSVRHTISKDAHKMKFVLVRNAMGPAPAAAGGGLPAV